jgi:hypothetical protein
LLTPQRCDIETRQQCCPEPEYLWCLTCLDRVALHVPGKDNVLAHNISRLHESSSFIYFLCYCLPAPLRLIHLHEHMSNEVPLLRHVTVALLSEKIITLLFRHCFAHLRVSKTTEKAICTDACRIGAGVITKTTGFMQTGW